MEIKNWIKIEKSSKSKPGKSEEMRMSLKHPNENVFKTSTEEMYIYFKARQNESLLLSSMSGGQTTEQERKCKVEIK